MRLEYRGLPAVSIPRSAVIVAADQVLSTTFDDEVVLLNQADGVYYGLRDVGARVWSLIERMSSLSAIQDAIADEYAVDFERSSADIHRLIADLIGRGLVVVQIR